MKISRIPHWFKNNILFLFVILSIGVVLSLLSLPIIYQTRLENKFPVGSSIVVKDTDIKGTVVKYNGDSVDVSIPTKNGTTENITINVNLLSK